MCQKKQKKGLSLCVCICMCVIKNKKQLRETNGIVVRSVCVTISYIAKACGKQMRSVIGRFMGVLWELLNVSVDLVPESAHQCSKILIKWVPDNSQNSILKTVIQGAMLIGWNEVRIACFEYLSILIEKAGKASADKVTADFWKRCRDGIKSGLNETNVDIRKAALKALHILEQTNALKASRLTDTLNAALVIEYQNIKSEMGTIS